MGCVGVNLHATSDLTRHSYSRLVFATAGKRAGVARRPKGVNARVRKRAGDGVYDNYARLKQRDRNPAVSKMGISREEARTR